MPSRFGSQAYWHAVMARVARTRETRARWHTRVASISQSVATTTRTRPSRMHALRRTHARRAALDRLDEARRTRWERPKRSQPQRAPPFFRGLIPRWPSVCTEPAHGTARHAPVQGPPLAPVKPALHRHWLGDELPVLAVPELAVQLVHTPLPATSEYVFAAHAASNSVADVAAGGQAPSAMATRC